MKKQKEKRGLKTKKERGITLIALVITIIVLLILAGVSIAMLTGENGVLTKATEAKDQTEIAQEKEEIKMAYAAAKANKEEYVANLVTADELNLELDKLNSKGEASGNEILTVTFLDSRRKYKINQTTGEITEQPSLGVEEDTLVYMFKKAQEDNCLDGSTCNREDHLHIGDYMNYEPVIGTSTESKKEENGYADQKYIVSGEDNWRVLGLNQDETQLLLTSGMPVKVAEIKKEDKYELNYNINFENIIISCGLFIQNVNFNGSVYFRNTTLQLNVGFYNSNFNKLLVFSHSDFYKMQRLEFDNIEFNNMLSFAYCNFDCRVEIKNSKFNGISFFIRNTFNSIFIFSKKCELNNIICFYISNFKSNLEFKNTIMNTIMYFRGSIFYSINR